MAATKTVRPLHKRLAKLDSIFHRSPLDRDQRRVKVSMALIIYAEELDGLLFSEDVKAVKKVVPEWGADRIAQELRDHGYGSRYGYGWTIRTARTALGEDLSLPYR